MLSQKGRYALKALLILAARVPGEAMPIGEIARTTNIPHKFLEAILLILKRANLVVSARGKSGGYSLARPASEISFGAIMRATDGPIALLPCVSRNFYRPCADCEEATCQLRKIMLDARHQIGLVLDGTTLADAIEDTAAPALG